MTPLIFAHRGASADAPENTLAAFKLAEQRGADGVELDAKLSKDGKIVVIHDQTVDRTTDGHGKVGDLTFAELRRLDAGKWFGAPYAGERIPMLEEVLDVLGGRVIVNIELTNYRSPNDPLPELAARLVQRSGFENRVMISSFFPSNLKRFKRLLPQVPGGFLTVGGWPGHLEIALLGLAGAIDALHPHFSTVEPRLIEQTHRHGLKINVWTVNDVEIMKKYSDWEVDGMITDVV